MIFRFLMLNNERFYKGKVMKTKLTELEKAKRELVQNAGGGVGVAIAIGAVALMVNGCIPLVTGIKKHTHSDGSVTEFITGADITFGANGVDSVTNERGIEPHKYKK